MKIHVLDFWLGFATLPGAALALAALYGAALLINRAGVWLVNRARFRTPKQARQRAQLAAVMAAARRSWWVRLPADTVLIVAVGHDLADFDAVHEAVYRVIGPKTPTIRKTREPAPAERATDDTPAEVTP